MTATVTHRSEKQEEADCDSLVRAFGGTVRRYDERRATRIHQGTADREYVVLGTVVRWEVKAEDGKLSQEQYDLLSEDARAGRIVGCGTVKDLQIVLWSTRESVGWGHVVGSRLVQLWAARGLRRSRKQRGAA